MTHLHEYIKQNPGFVRVYETARANAEMISRIQSALPAARVVTVCEYWCGDCRRHVPRMARIAELLPGWTFEIYPWDRERRDKPWHVRAVPTFIVLSGNQEIGRIVENPAHGSLEEDLLAMTRDL
jgi:hypothetical protein